MDLQCNFMNLCRLTRCICLLCLVQRCRGPQCHGPGSSEAAVANSVGGRRRCPAGRRGNQSSFALRHRRPRDCWERNSGCCLVSLEYCQVMVLKFRLVDENASIKWKLKIYDLRYIQIHEVICAIITIFKVCFFTFIDIVCPPPWTSSLPINKISN